jgi:hypothetical protein
MPIIVLYIVNNHCNWPNTNCYRNCNRTMFRVRFIYYHCFRFRWSRYTSYSITVVLHQAGNTFTVTTSGNYTITVKMLIIVLIPATLLQLQPQLTLNAILNKDITCNLRQQTHKLLWLNRWSWSVYYTQSPYYGSFSVMCLQQKPWWLYIYSNRCSRLYTTTAAIL